MTVYAIAEITTAAGNNQAAFETPSMSSGDFVVVGTKEFNDPDPMSSPVIVVAYGVAGIGIRIQGPHSTVIVGGIVGTAGVQGVGIAFEGGGIFDPASPDAIVQTVVVTPGGQVADGGMGEPGAARIKLKPGLVQALDLTNHGTFLGKIAVEAGDYADRVVSTGSMKGDISLFGGNDILKLSGNFGPMVASLGDGDDTVTIGMPSAIAGPISFALGAGNDTFTSLKSFGVVTGDEGNDTITIGAALGAGGGSYDGGAGDDIVFAGTGGDTMIGGSGTDTVSYVFATAAVGIDATLGSGSGEAAGDTIVGFENFVGSAFGDTIAADGGANILNGLGGADVLLGRGGNDTYVVDSNLDVVSEAGGGGVDLVEVAASSFTFAPGIEAAKVTRAQGASVFGLASNDIIGGGAGADRLYGRDGLDTLTGGAGKDAFVFDRKPIKGKADKITDFSVADDNVWVDNAVFKGLKTGWLKADAFYSGSKPHDASDRFFYNPKNGYLYYDADGTGSAGALAIGLLAKNLKLTYHDFLVV